MSLTRLPCELLAAVTAHVPKHDLLALRSTCREVSAAVDDAFTKAYFSERTHLFDSFGLQALVEITAHPQFSRRIKKISLVVRELDPYMRMEPVFDAVNTSNSLLDCGTADRPQQYTWNTRGRKWVEECRKTKEASLGLLVQIFNNLHSAKLIPSISVGVQERHTQVYGTGHLLELLGPGVAESDFDYS